MHRDVDNLSFNVLAYPKSIANSNMTLVVTVSIGVINLLKCNKDEGRSWGHSVTIYLELK
jgi:hypothetical protein